MNRIIKFRAWDKVQKRMFNITNLTWDITGQLVYFLTENISPPMQFTGLTDKNGKEIYEGDIVKYKKHEGYLLDDFIAEIIWKDVQWSISDPKGKMRDVDFGEVDEFDDVLDHLDVIGNIYENPELLTYPIN